MSKVKEKRRARGKTPSRKGSDAGKASSGSWRRIRENAEAVLVAIILALIIRHFSLEAFEIPTGSMAPGLNGVHVVATCPNCDTSESIGIETDPLSGKVRTDRFRSGIIYEGPCPECGGLIQDGGPQLRQGAPVYCAGCREHRIGELGLYRVSKAFSQVKVWCHECTLEYTEIFEPRNCLGGHKILVNKFTYQTREPRRWEVIVFKFNRQRNYIKRLVGLPGESIRVRDGDIWIDGALERKPQWAQDDLWFPVHDTSIKERGLVREPAWREDGGRSWQPEKDTTGFRFNALEGSARLRYQRPIFNRYSYNQVRFHGSRREARIRDLRVVADLTLRGGKGRVALDVVNGDRTYRCSIPAGGGGEDDRRETILGILEEGAEGAGGGIRPLKILSGIALERDLPHLLDFSVADRQMVLRIDGESIAEVPLDEEADRWAGIGEPSTVAIAVEGVGGQLRRIRTFRDIHYTARGNELRNAVHEAYQIPSDGYFAMGDNSPSSLDSRAWGALSRQNLLGRAFAIFWPALPWRWEIGFIR